MESAIKTALLLLGLAFAQSASAVLLLIQWDAGSGYPVGTTYDLQVNSTLVTGIATTSYNWAENLTPGAAITVQVRAVPPGGQGYTNSSWLVVSGNVPYVTPSAPTNYKLIKWTVTQ